MNKILLKTAAAVNIAAAAIIYIACSGDDGKDGRGCTLSPVVGTSDIQVTCGDQTGILTQGPKGDKGDPGLGGGGSDGCYLQAQAGSATAFDVICGTANVGTIYTSSGSGGCSVTELSDYYQFTCADGRKYDLAKAWCNYGTGTNVGVVAYDPDDGVCDPSASSKEAAIKRNCDGVGYDYQNLFCAPANLAGEAKKTILARCGAKPNDDGKIGSTPDSLGEYNPATQFCLNSAPTSSSSSVDHNWIYPAANLIPTGTPPSQTGTANLLSGVATNLCGTLKSKFTKYDFCSTAGTVLKRCGDVGSANGSYNPAISFCQYSATVVTDPPVSAQNGVGVGANQAGSIQTLCGTGRFTTGQFCASAIVFPKCGSAGSNFSNFTGGEYDVTKEYCYLDDNSNGDKALKLFGACGGANVLNESTHACVNNTTAYPICEGLRPAAASSGTAYDVTKKFCDARSQVIVKPGTVVSGTPIVVSGGKLYDYVTLGTQTWMAIDLGTAVSAGNRAAVVSADDDIPINVNVLPGLNSSNANLKAFNWAVATDNSNSICPSGWRLPSEDDWNTLAAAAGAQAGLALRSGKASDWGEKASTSEVFSKFAAVSAGIPTSSIAEDESKLRVFSGAAATATARSTGKFNVWWTSNALDENNAYIRVIQENNMTVDRGSFNKLANSFSIRCIKN